MRTPAGHRVPADPSISSLGTVEPDFFDGVDRARALRAPARDEVSGAVACAMDVPAPVVDPVCATPPWGVTTCSEGYPSLSNPWGAWTTDMSPPAPRKAPVRVAPPTSMAGMVQAIHHVLHGRLDPLARIEHRDLWHAYARALIQRGDPLGEVIGRAVLGDPIHRWFTGLDGAQLLGGLMRLGSWIDARWDRGLRIDLDGNHPHWTALERVASEFAFLRLVVHDLQPELLNIVGDTPRMQSLTFTNQNLDWLDLSTIERFGPLTALDLQGFTIRDLVPLRVHERIEQLRIVGCRGSLDLGMLEHNEELIDLHVGGCPTAERWSSLPGLEQLRRLTVSDQVEWTQLDPIRDCRQITSLELDGMELVDELTPLTTLTALEELELRDLGIVDVRELPDIEHLTELTLARNHQLRDLTALAGCSRLERVTLHRLMWVRDLTAVVRIRTLRALTVSKCRRLTEIAPFPPGSLLEELTVVGCPAIEDLHGIANCGHLRVVRLAGTSVASVRDFVGLPNLEAVVLLEPERDPALREALRRVRAVEKPADDLAVGHPDARAWVMPSNAAPPDDP